MRKSSGGYGSRNRSHSPTPTKGEKDGNSSAAQQSSSLPRKPLITSITLPTPSESRTRVAIKMDGQNSGTSYDQSKAAIVTQRTRDLDTYTENLPGRQGLTTTLYHLLPQSRILKQTAEMEEMLRTGPESWMLDNDPGNEHPDYNFEADGQLTPRSSIVSKEADTILQKGVSAQELSKRLHALFRSDEYLEAAKKKSNTAIDPQTLLLSVNDLEKRIQLSHEEKKVLSDISGKGYWYPTGADKQKDEIGYVTWGDLATLKGAKPPLDKLWGKLNELIGGGRDKAAKIFKRGYVDKDPTVKVLELRKKEHLENSTVVKQDAEAFDRLVSIGEQADAINKAMRIKETKRLREEINQASQKLLAQFGSYVLTQDDAYVKAYKAIKEKHIEGIVAQMMAIDTFMSEEGPTDYVKAQRADLEKKLREMGVTQEEYQAVQKRVDDAAPDEIERIKLYARLALPPKPETNKERVARLGEEQSVEAETASNVNKLFDELRAMLEKQAQRKGKGQKQSRKKVVTKKVNLQDDDRKIFKDLVDIYKIESGYGEEIPLAQWDESNRKAYEQIDQFSTGEKSTFEEGDLLQIKKSFTDLGLSLSDVDFESAETMEEQDEQIPALNAGRLSTVTTLSGELTATLTKDYVQAARASLSAKASDVEILRNLFDNSDYEAMKQDYMERRFELPVVLYKTATALKQLPPTNGTRKRIETDAWNDYTARLKATQQTRVDEALTRMLVGIN